MGPPPGGRMGPPPGGQFGGPGGFGGEFGGPQGGPGGQSGQGQFGEGQYGPSEEEMQKRQEQMEKRQQEQESKMKKQGLQQMKRGMKQFSTMLNRFKAKIDQLEKQGTPIPADCKENVEKAVTLVQTILTAEEIDFETFDMSELQSAGEVLQECGPKIEQAAQLPRIIKQVNAQITRLEKRVKSIETRGIRAKLDLSEALQPISAGLAQFKAELAALKDSDDPFAFMEELPERFQEIEQDINSLESIFQLQQVVKKLNGQITRYEQKVKRLEKTGEGAEARAILDELKGVAAELKGLKITVDTAETAPEIIERAFELAEQLEEELGISQGSAPLFQLQGKSALPQINVPQLEKLMLQQKTLKKALVSNRARSVATDN